MIKIVICVCRVSRRRAVMDLLSREEVCRVAEKVGEGRRVVGHRLCRKGEESLGYLGKHLSLVLELSSAGERRAFVKTYETRGKGEDFLGESGIFEREQEFYRVVVEEVKELMGEPEWCPDYYLSKERVLVLEDLSERGFRMVEGRWGQWELDGEHIKAALRTLASMHGTSIVMEEREGEALLEKYPSIFGRDVLYDEKKPDAPTRKWVTWQIQDLVEGVQYLKKYSQEEKRFIRDHFEKRVMRIYNLSKPSDKYRNVLTHGDMWRNNLLFRYSDEGEPVECRFVDFQFVRYAPPAHDVMHLLHFAMKKETRQKSQSHFVRFYHENLSEELKRHGLDGEEELHADELVDSCTEYKELALIQCLLSLHYILGSATLAVDAAESYDRQGDYLMRHRKNYMAEFFDRRCYADRITDIFEELIDGYILREETDGRI